MFFYFCFLQFLKPGDELHWLSLWKIRFKFLFGLDCTTLFNSNSVMHTFWIGVVIFKHLFLFNSFLFLLYKTLVGRIMPFEISIGYNIYFVIEIRIGWLAVLICLLHLLLKFVVWLYRLSYVQAVEKLYFWKVALKLSFISGIQWLFMVFQSILLLIRFSECWRHFSNGTLVFVSLWSHSYEW